jgi:hypothetical protein
LRLQDCLLEGSPYRQRTLGERFGSDFTTKALSPADA